MEVLRETINAITGRKELRRSWTQLEGIETAYPSLYIYERVVCLPDVKAQISRSKPILFLVLKMQNWITSLFSHLSSKKFLEEHKTFQPHHVRTSVLQIHAKSIHNLLHPSVALRFKQYRTREVVQHQLEARDTVIERSRLAAITATVIATETIKTWTDPARMKPWLEAAGFSRLPVMKLLQLS